MSNSEKITVNVNVVDLGKIDLLVEKGFYSNRTDFIKTAIRNQIENQNYVIKDIIIKNNFSLGIVSYSKKDLEMLLVNGEKINIKVVGMLILKDDISEDLALTVINSIEIKGVFKVNTDLKNKLSQIIKSI